MKKTKGLNYLYFTLFIVIVLTACTPRTDFVVYEGKPLRIAVIGELPEVKEEQVEFENISFDEIKSDRIASYDAVIITEEKLIEASESQYADVYSQSKIPFFFISASSPIPFTVKDVEYDSSWKWTAGTSYAVGVLTLQEEKKSWGIGLYNDEKTGEHIEAVYSIIFQTIEEL